MSFHRSPSHTQKIERHGSTNVVLVCEKCMLIGLSIRFSEFYFSLKHVERAFRSSFDFHNTLRELHSIEHPISQKLDAKKQEIICKFILKGSRGHRTLDWCNGNSPSECRPSRRPWSRTRWRPYRLYGSPHLNLRVHNYKR